MRNKNNKHLGIEIDPELLYKLQYIAKYEGRSGNGQILYLIRKCITEFEKTEGEICYPPEEKDWRRKDIPDYTHKSRFVMWRKCDIMVVRWSGRWNWGNFYERNDFRRSFYDIRSAVVFDHGGNLYYQQFVKSARTYYRIIMFIVGIIICVCTLVSD